MDLWCVLRMQMTRYYNTFLIHKPKYEFSRLVHLVTLFPLTKKTTDLVSWVAPNVYNVMCKLVDENLN